MSLQISNYRGKNCTWFNLQSSSNYGRDCTCFSPPNYCGKNCTGFSFPNYCGKNCTGFSSPNYVRNSTGKDPRPPAARTMLDLVLRRVLRNQAWLLFYYSPGPLAVNSRHQNNLDVLAYLTKIKSCGGTKYDRLTPVAQTPIERIHSNQENLDSSLQRRSCFPTFFGKAESPN